MWFSKLVSWNLFSGCSPSDFTIELDGVEFNLVLPVNQISHEHSVETLSTIICAKSLLKKFCRVWSLSWQKLPNPATKIRCIFAYFLINDVQRSEIAVFILSTLRFSIVPAADTLKHNSNKLLTLYTNRSSAFPNWMLLITRINEYSSSFFIADMTSVACVSNTMSTLCRVFLSTKH